MSSLVFSSASFLFGGDPVSGAPRRVSRCVCIFHTCSFYHIIHWNARKTFDSPANFTVYRHGFASITSMDFPFFRRAALLRAKAGQNDIISNAANGLPWNDTIVLSSKKTQFAASGNDNGNQPTGTGINFHIAHKSQSAAIPNADDFLTPQIYNAAARPAPVVIAMPFVLTTHVNPPSPPQRASCSKIVRSSLDHHDYTAGYLSDTPHHA